MRWTSGMPSFSRFSWLLVVAAFSVTCGGDDPTPPSRSPTVNSVVPALGPATGGTNVTVSGSSFQSGDTLLIGGVAATNVNVVNNSTITATTAPRAAGTVGVAVRTSGGATGPTLSNGFSYWTITANAGGPYLVNDHTQPVTVSATGSTSTPFPIVRFVWDCGQTVPRVPANCALDGTNPTPQWRYFRSQAGFGRSTNYTVRLTIFDSQGNSADATATVTVTDFY